jgi:hypothetical protein
MERNQSSSRIAIVALGMHRSGTADLARVLSFYGFALPQDQIQPGAANTIEEASGISALNERILASLGGSWGAPGPFIVPGQSLRESQETITRMLSDRWLDQATATLTESFGDASAIVLCDPRLCLLLPLWQRALIKADYEPHYILCYRHPLAVATSLAVNDRLSRSRALQLWVHYAIEPLAFGQAFIEGAVFYDDLLDDHVRTLSPILAGVRSPVPLSDETAGAASVLYLDQMGRGHAAVSQDLAAESDLVRSVWRLLTAWNDIMSAPDGVTEAVAHIREKFAEAAQFAGLARSAWGVFTTADRQKRSAFSIVDAPPGEMMILHYHLFKNAGTSVDEVLRWNFGSAWSEQEFPIPRDTNVADFPFNTVHVGNYLREHPELNALSSHTALLPVPEIEGFAIFPIIFLRHPIDRLRSAFLFEVLQDASSYGARLAKMQGFAGYLRELIHHPVDRSAQSFQTYRLSMNEPASAGSELDRALRVLSGSGFVGLVEAYDASMIRLGQLLVPRFEGFRTFSVHANVSQSGRVGLGEKLARIRAEIGDELFAEVVSANADDIVLFETMAARYLYEG